MNFKILVLIVLVLVFSKVYTQNYVCSELKYLEDGSVTIIDCPKQPEDPRYYQGPPKDEYAAYPDCCPVYILPPSWKN
ncbi:hypothetical protein DLAC_05070 [Tieghemostelium lacteum]|uniref:Single domain-containing protein n=1 Tax=Tieghemostelium lacteum TaxID=361077 RepID=A0A151ZI92_TIELA|nr:hypothetical protein DLAC_05070 [Tieghemostelium lacteum]|eukprot:KYQ93683.1 hypothetical protein DLAC_05070 [Tieghemostelium lacteum]